MNLLGAEYLQRTTEAKLKAMYDALSEEDKQIRDDIIRVAAPTKISHTSTFYDSRLCPRHWIVPTHSLRNKFSSITGPTDFDSLNGVSGKLSFQSQKSSIGSHLLDHLKASSLSAYSRCRAKRLLPPPSRPNLTASSTSAPSSITAI